MPARTELPSLSPSDRRREIAVILARGVLRWRRRFHTGGVKPTPDSPDSCDNHLELPGETRLSVSDGTQGLCLRDDGDNAWT